MSRAFGDRAFKKQGMSALPDIQAFTLSEREAFLLMGCDGFWGERRWGRGARAGQGGLRRTNKESEQRVVCCSAVTASGVSSTVIPDGKCIKCGVRRLARPCT